MGYDGDNLLNRRERMPQVFNGSGLIIGWGGYDSEMRLYNRAISFRPGVGYIFRVLKNDPNSGLFVKANAGWFTQRTMFYQNYSQAPVPQLEGDYRKLYDHNRNGAILSQSIGFIYMSNYNTYINFKVSLELSECFSWSTRSYQLDQHMGLQGKDGARYFDLLAGVKISWMFPITGRTAYDYYYY